MMDFLELIQTRKSIRSFSDKTVSRALIEKVLSAATYAPTNCNQQLWNFTVIKESTTKERLIKEAASNTLLRRSPVVVVVSYDGWNYKEALQGGALAVGHMLLAAHHYGLGSMPMNSYGADTKVKKILNIPDNQTICCFVLLGYPDARAEHASLVPRRSVKEATHWNSFTPQQSISYEYDPEKWSKKDLIAHQKYYCRKTFLGKEMDIMSSYERELVRRELRSLKGPVHDYFSYDGAYLREFPSEVSLTTFDLCEETAAYTEAAAHLADQKVTTKVFGARDGGSRGIAASSSIFKNERIPHALRQQLYKNVRGELIIIARKRNLFLSFFFFVIQHIFGSDVRKTGIYTFFGPYRPLSLGRTLEELKTAGFKDLEWHGYFFFPALYEQIYQMFLQYRASEGSSYLHRERRSNIITKLISLVLRIQGFMRFGWLGSVVVIRCHK